MIPFSRLVIATHNLHKAGEMATILKSLLPEIELLTLRDFPGCAEPEESGITYAENASIKALAAARVTESWALADDAGLEIEALGGAPGLKSKRFIGADAPFDQKMHRILELLSQVSPDNRKGRFRCSIALADPEQLDRPRLLISAICEGAIASEPCGEGGFGYDPIFYLPELGCTMAQLSPEEKHRVSHRGKVLRALVKTLQSSP